MAGIEIYCDGSSRKISEVVHAGYGVYIDGRDNPEIGEVFISCAVGAEKTNDISELEAFNAAMRWKLENIPNEKVEIFSDARYVVDSYNKYLLKWCVNGYKKANGEEIANLALIKEMYELKKAAGKSVKVTHCYGHSGIHGNELADGLANNGAVRSSQSLYGQHIKVIKNNSGKEVKQEVVVKAKPVLNPFIYAKRLLVSLYQPFKEKTLNGDVYGVFHGANYSDDKDDHDRYFGKPATEAFYVVGFTKNKDSSIQAMSEYIKALPENRYNHSVILNYTAMSMPAARNLLASDGKEAVISCTDNYKLITENSTVARVLIKPLLAMLAMKHFADMEDILTNYVNGSYADMAVINIDNLFVPEKKGFSVHPSIKMNDKTFPVKFMNKNIDLHFGFDIPQYATLKKMAKETRLKCKATLLVTVFKGDGTNGKESIITTHHLVMEFDGNYLIHHSPNFSLRPY